MNNDRFTELLSRYLDGNATEEEVVQLMQLIREGAYDEKIKEEIHARLLHEPVSETIDSGKAQEMISDILERGDHQRVIPMRRSTTKWRWVAAAAVLLISVTVGWWAVNPERTHLQPLTAIDEEDVQYVVFSGKQLVHLPDGSTVLMNDGTELRYATSFGKQDRNVTLSGEGYFDVKHNDSIPFNVLTGKITTTVLGTAFNVKAYPGEEEIEVTVTRGKVQVKDDRRTLGIITPDQQIAVQTSTLDFVQTTVDADTEKPWQDQYLVFDDVSLEEAVKRIGERYSVDITLANDKLRGCRISATFLNGENLDQVLTVVTGVVHATYVMLPGGRARIEGKGCKT